MDHFTTNRLTTNRLTTNRTTTDLLELDRRAVRFSGAVVAQVRPEHLDLPTPCAEWNLGQLLAHMIGQHYGFAAAALGAGPDLRHWADRPVDDDPAGTYDRAANAVLEAFAVEGVLDRERWLPELSTDDTFRAVSAVRAHLSDYVAHGWDVARAIGVEVDLADDPELVAAALAVAEGVPDVFRGPGQPFRAPVPVPDDAPDFHRFLALFGRDPARTPAR